MRWDVSGCLEGMIAATAKVGVLILYGRLEAHAGGRRDEARICRFGVSSKYEQHNSTVFEVDVGAGGLEKDGSRSDSSQSECIHTGINKILGCSHDQRIGESFRKLWMDESKEDKENEIYTMILLS